MATKTLTDARAQIFALLLALLHHAAQRFLFAAGTAGGSPSKASEPKPTIVLVHGAWADSSGWNESVKTAGEQGYTALAVANPLRGL